MLLPWATLGFVSFCTIFLSLKLIGLSPLSPGCDCSWLELGAAVSILQMGLFYGGCLISCQLNSLSDVNDI